MAIITETTDVPVDTWIPATTLNQGDTFAGFFGAGDPGDSVWVNTWSNTMDYNVTVAGLDDMSQTYTVQITDILHPAYTVSVTVENGVVTSVSDSQNQVLGVTVTADGFVVSFSPAYNQSYGVTIFNPSGTADSAYTLTVAEVGVEPPLPPVPLITEEADTVTGTAGNDVFDLLGGNDTLDAGDGDDDAFGGNGNDVMNGDGGNDLLNGAGGNDILNGGTGNDTLLGGQGHDSLDGGADDDLLNGGNGEDTLNGGDGADFLIGGTENDVLNGGAGNDTLEGGFGNDTMAGGAGADTFIVIPNNGQDQIDGFEPGVDVIDLTGIGATGMGSLSISQVGTDTLIDLGGGNQILLTATDAGTVQASSFAFVPSPILGSAAADVLNGTASGDSLSGGDGDDKLYGHDGDDSLSGGNDRDTLDGGAGADTLDGGNGNDHLIGGIGADVLSGGNNNDKLYGGDDGDILNGDQGNDKLFGDAGADTIDGGRGRDQLTGGADADVFVFGANAGLDTIMDFENGIDMIDLTALGLTDMTDLRIVQIGGNVQIYLDASFANGVTLIGTDVVDLDASDFLF